MAGHNQTLVPITYENADTAKLGDTVLPRNKLLRRENLLREREATLAYVCSICTLAAPFTRTDMFKRNLVCTFMVR